MARTKPAAEPAAAPEPRSWTTDDVVVEVETGEKRTLNGWLGSDVEAPTVAVRDLDGNPIEFDDLTGRPADVTVYVDGRPAPVQDAEPTP